MRMQTSLPSQKVTAAALAAAIVQIAVWTSSWAGFAFPAEVAAAITVILTFLAGYIAPPNQRDQVAH